MSTSNSKASAHDVSVSEAAPESNYKTVIAEQADFAVKAITQQIKHLQASLKTAQAEATRLRAEAKES